MTDKDEERKKLSEISDDDLMNEVKKVVDMNKIAEIGKKSNVINTAFEWKRKRSGN